MAQYFFILLQYIMEKMEIQRKDYVQDIQIGNIKKTFSILSSFSKDNCSESDLGSYSSTTKKPQPTFPPNQNTSNRKRGVNVRFCKNQLQDLAIQQLSNDTSAVDFKHKSTRKQVQMQRTKSLNQQKNVKILFNSYRMNNIKTTLLNKLRKNSIYRIPVVYQPFKNNSNQNQQWKGIQIQKIIINLALAYNIAYIFIACLITTFLITFQEILYSQNFLTLFQVCCFITLILEILMGFIRVKEVGSRKLTKIRQISFHYLRSTFVIDLFCMFSMLVCLISSNKEIDYFLGIYFLKIPDCIHNLQKIQTKVLISFYRQQYWGLMKILLTNFFYAHCIATILVMMSWLDDNQSWMHLKNIENAPWYEQYSWAYYWGTTIMLTVGFGDIAAANYKQAICLVLIQTISCMALAYNINCIGNLLVDIKSNQLQKQKNLKVLKKLCDKNEVHADLNFKLTNHIKQSLNIQKKYNFKEQTQLISKLPIYLKQQLYRSTNQKYLKNLTFIKNFTNRTILAIAQKIQMKISHPDQILIQATNSNFNKIIILKQGEIGLVPHYNYQKYNNIIIDKFSVQQGQSTVLISLDFLHLPVDRNYHIKSIVYSQIYQMQLDKLLSILKNKDVDLQYFYTIKHKDKQQFDIYQIIDCKYCQSKHNKFRCPKLHFMPISQQVIYKYLHKIKIAKNQRRIFAREKNNIKILQQYRSIGQVMRKSLRSISDNYDLCKSKQQIVLSNNSNFGYVPRKQIVSIDDIAYSNKQAGKKYIKYQLNQIKAQTYVTAVEIVQKQMRGILGKNQDFWNVQTDQGKNYRYYFSKSNPKLLQNITFKRQKLIKFKSNIFQTTKIKKFSTFAALTTPNRKNY